jgi:hypothetical protein
MKVRPERVRLVTTAALGVVSASALLLPQLAPRLVLASLAITLLLAALALLPALSPLRRAGGFTASLVLTLVAVAQPLGATALIIIISLASLVLGLASLFARGRLETDAA